VRGVAYSGGKMALPGWKHPVVVDLAGMEIPESVPLLTNHENRTSARVGMVAARIEEGVLVIEGEIVSSNGQAAGILEQATAGADWQLSIGAEVKKSELVRAGTRVVNGQEHAAPFHHVTESVLREVSVVAVGADATTHLKVTALFTLTGAVPAPEEGSQGAATAGGASPAAAQASQAAGASPAAGVGQTARAATPDAGVAAAAQAVAAERERVAGIQRACAGEFPEIEREAVNAGWTVHTASQKVLAAIRAARPMADVNIAVRRDPGPAFERRVLEAALCLRASIAEADLVRHYGEEVVGSASRNREISLHQLFVECARLEGIAVPRSFGNDTIRAAFSTVSLPGILNSVANKRLLKAFEAQPVIATRLCSEGELNDFKESERYRLTDVGDLEPVAPDGEIKHGGLTEEKATNQLGTFGKIFALTRQMIYNDDLGAFLKVPDGMGARAARKIDQLFFLRLLANPNSLFSLAHKNYREGTDTALSGDSLALAVQLFLDQVDSDGQPINVSPRFLLVPTGLKMTARELLNSTFYIATGTAEKRRIPTYNALADEDLEVISSPYLSNANYPGASSVAWYLFADPAVVDTFEIGYLKGRRTPTVERGETDFDTLGIKFRVYFDLGVREQDHRGMTKFKGEA
ncbi:MAG: hypothetical protein KBA95_19040, partial [Acidobacteria bacterium]|nr:hypothetical protein [Acidobacteriota bacterium]